MSFINICSITGHRWRYKDYTHAMKSDGSKYGFTSTRICKRCEKKQFKFTSKWVEEIRFLNQRFTESFCGFRLEVGSLMLLPQLRTYLQVVLQEHEAALKAH
ncbi:MAG: hypothetical protein ABI855_09230 [Bacteroidota bacterium]